MAATKAPTDEQVFAEALSSYGGENARYVLKNPKLIKATADLVKAYGKKDYPAGASAIASLGSTTLKNTSQNVQLKQGATAASATLSTFKTTMDFIKIANAATPNQALVIAGAATVQKVGIGLGLVGSDNEQAKCLGAIMELAGSATITAVGSAINPVLGWLTWASLAANGLNAGLVCTPVIDEMMK